MGLEHDLGSFQTNEDFMGNTQTRLRKDHDPMMPHLGFRTVPGIPTAGFPFFSRCFHTKSSFFFPTVLISLPTKLENNTPQIGNTPNFGYLLESLAVLPGKSENVSQLCIFFSRDHYPPCASGKEASETQGGAQLNRQLRWVECVSTLSLAPLSVSLSLSLWWLLLLLLLLLLWSSLLFWWWDVRCML